MREWSHERPAGRLSNLQSSPHDLGFEADSLIPSRNGSDLRLNQPVSDAKVALPVPSPVGSSVLLGQSSEKTMVEPDASGAVRCADGASSPRFAVRTGNPLILGALCDLVVKSSFEPALGAGSFRR